MARRLLPLGARRESNAGRRRSRSQVSCSRRLTVADHDTDPFRLLTSRRMSSLSGEWR